MHEIKREIIYELLKYKEFQKFIQMALDDLYGYANFVMREEERLTIIRINRDEYDLEGYQFAIKELDTQRKLRHDSAINSISVLNRMCAQKGLEKVYEGDLSKDYDTRNDIAECIFRFAKTSLERGKDGHSKLRG